MLRRIRHAAPLIVPPALSIPGSPPPTPIQMLGSNANLHSRQSRGVCIGNIADTNEQHRAEFFNQKTTDMNIGIALILVVTCFEGIKTKTPAEDYSDTLTVFPPGWVVAETSGFPVRR